MLAGNISRTTQQRGSPTPLVLSTIVTLPNHPGKLNAAVRHIPLDAHDCASEQAQFSLYSFPLTQSLAVQFKYEMIRVSHLGVSPHRPKLCSIGLHQLFIADIDQRQTQYSQYLRFLTVKNCFSWGLNLRPAYRQLAHRTSFPSRGC